jgi:hypothetical protein
MLRDILKEIPDERTFHGKEYELDEILLCAILAMLSGAKTYVDIMRFTWENYEALNEEFKFNWRVRPTASCIRKIIVRIDKEEMEKAFRKHSSLLQSDNTEQKHYCFDGKVLRGSLSNSKNQKATSIFNVFSASDQIVIAHSPLGDNKDHEISAFQKLLEKMVLDGVVVTVDALHCQKKLLKRQKKQELY